MPDNEQLKAKCSYNVKTDKLQLKYMFIIRLEC